MQNKFDYSAVKDDVNKIEDQLKKMNRSLADIRTGLEFMTSSNNWSALSQDYLLKESKRLFSSIENVDAISKNINAYLDGVMTNYKELDEGIEGLFSSFFGGGK